MKSFTDFFYSIDYKLLSAQKNYLISLPETEEVNGLLSLIDCLQDVALDNNVEKEEKIFEYFSVNN